MQVDQRGVTTRVHSYDTKLKTANRFYLKAVVVVAIATLLRAAPADGLGGMLISTVELHLLHSWEFFDRQRTRTT